MANNIHPMTKKGIKNFIKKNNLNEAYIEKIDTLKTYDELNVFNEEIKNNEQELYKYILSKIEGKITNSNHSLYLQYDVDVLNNILNPESDNLKDKNMLKLIENKQFKDILKIIKEKRDSESQYLNIHAYCIDNLARLVNITLKNIQLINSETCKRQDFLEAISVTNSNTLLQVIAFEYFAMNIDKTKLNNEQLDYIFKYLRNNNVKKNIFDARDIKTIKNFTDKIVSLFKYLIKGDKKHLIDLYSITKVFELFITLA